VTTARVGAKIVGCTVAVAAALVFPAASRTASDPPRIVPWHQIGAVGLGMQRASVNYRYGNALGPNPTYTVSGGHLNVGYAGNQVALIYTDSRRYRTTDGVGVGSQIPLGRCYRTRTSACQHRWHEFAYAPGFAPEWETFFCYGGVRAEASLAVDRGVVTMVRIAFAAGVCGDARPKSPLTAADRTEIRAAIETTLGAATIRIYKVASLKVTVDAKLYASLTVFGKDKVTGAEEQPQFAILKHRAGWRVIDYGTSGVGCGRVPIKYLTQIGGTCPG
jgi:hypothetical protein